MNRRIITNEEIVVNFTKKYIDVSPVFTIYNMKLYWWKQKKKIKTLLVYNQIRYHSLRRILCILQKNFDYPEKPLKYKHIRRISDWFYYQFTTFNGLRLDMPEHLASMKQPNTNATHWRRGTSAITQFHIAPHWRRYLIPTGKQGTPLFFYPHVTQ